MNYCPDCNTALNPGSTKCPCGWVKGKATGGMKCLCGRMSRTIIEGKHLCWKCYYSHVEGTEHEDWRDRMVREKVKHGGRPEDYRKAAKELARRK